MKYTEEQEIFIESAADKSHNTMTIARAGSGKTTTNLAAVRNIPRKENVALIYFNTQARKDALAKVGDLPNVRVWTNHTIPFAAIGSSYADKHRCLGIDDKNVKRFTSKQVAEYFGIPDMEFQGESGPVKVTSETLAQLASKTVTKFTHDTAWGLKDYHVPYVPALDEILPELRPVVVTYAKQLWYDKKDLNRGILPVTPDDYLKLWSMATKKDRNGKDQSTAWFLGIKHLYVDEFQDTNPCMWGIIRRHSACKLVFTGDPSQAIYGFRDAKNYLTDEAMQSIRKYGQPMPYKTCYLSQSWRFGQAVADEGNKWLTYDDESVMMRGNPAIESRIVTDMTDPDMILCRTNAGVVSAALGMIREGRTYSLHNGTEALKALAKGLGQLMAGMPSDHPDLLGFADFKSFERFAMDDPNGSDFRTIVQLVSEHGTEAITEIAESAVDREMSDTHIATAHTQKGAEAGKVKIHSDFAPKLSTDGEIQPPTSEFAKVAYVAVTRAVSELDRGPLDCIDTLTDYEPETEESE